MSPFSVEFTFSIQLIKQNTVFILIFLNTAYILMPEINNLTEVHDMKYICDVCGYEYDEALGDPDNGIAPGTKWEDVPEDWVCPLCQVGKDQFSQE